MEVEDILSCNTLIFKSASLDCCQSSEVTASSPQPGCEIVLWPTIESFKLELNVKVTIASSVHNEYCQYQTEKYCTWLKKYFFFFCILLAFIVKAYGEVGSLGIKMLS